MQADLINKSGSIALNFPKQAKTLDHENFQTNRLAMGIWYELRHQLRCAVAGASWAVVVNWAVRAGGGARVFY